MKKKSRKKDMEDMAEIAMLFWLLLQDEEFVNDTVETISKTGKMMEDCMKALQGEKEQTDGK